MGTIKHKTGSANPKVYVALLNQTYVSSAAGLLVVGKYYQIDVLAVGDDFANVGYVALSTPFVATGTTPTVWANATEVINLTDSAPVATVLESTLGEVPLYAYESANKFNVISTGIFLANKVDPAIANSESAGVIKPCAVTRSSDVKLKIFAENDVLVNTRFEIRLYP